MGVSVMEMLHNSRGAAGSAAGGSAETSSEGGTSGEGEDEERIEIDDQLKELLPGTAPDLQSREAGKSVRTTFQLSAEATSLFGRLSGRTGKSQKELLGEALCLSRRALEKSPERVRAAAARYKDRPDAAKPMAIAPEVRTGLNELAEEEGLHRDYLVEVGIRLAKLAVEEPIRQKIRPHEDILEDLRDLYREVEEVQIALTSHPDRSRSENHEDPVSYDDPVEQALFDILGTLRSMAEAIEASAESGTPIEEDREFP